MTQVDTHSFWVEAISTDIPYTHAHLDMYILAYLHTSIHIFIRSCITLIQRYSHVCTFIQTYKQLYIPTNIHAYIPTYILTDVHTHVYTYVHALVHAHSFPVQAGIELSRAYVKEFRHNDVGDLERYLDLCVNPLQQCNVLQFNTATHCNTPRVLALFSHRFHCNALLHTSTMQHTASHHCTTPLQHTATHLVS